MKVALLPLDERPVNTRYPRMIAAMAGAELILPDRLSSYRTPADPAALIDWLRASVGGIDALIVSLEMLGCGGLIASRLSAEPASQIAARLDVLRQIKHAQPTLKIYAFNVITRIPNYNDAVEEPAYWNEYGAALHQLSRLYDLRGRGRRGGLYSQIMPLEMKIPAKHRRDWLTRRLRNHTINLCALDLLAHDVFDLLVLSSDDTSPEGLGTREKAWLRDWAQLALPDDPRLLMYPGADEVGSVLVARALLNGQTPRFRIDYALDADKDRIAPYEDGAVSLTLERQIHAIGGVIVNADDLADYVVMVNPPSPLGREYDHAHAAAERAYRLPHLRAFVARIADLIAADQRVIVADVAYPNGADPLLIDLLREQIDLTRLAAYGAWNTAGNTIGAALAHGVTLGLAHTDSARDLHEEFLAHRFIEDWAYQHVVREQVRDWLEANTGTRDTTPENQARVTEMIEAYLRQYLASLPGLGARWRIVERSVYLPWNRTFEVDFDLERV